MHQALLKNTLINSPWKQLCERILLLYFTDEETEDREIMPKFRDSKQQSQAWNLDNLPQNLCS